MKVSVKSAPKKFEPKTIEITVESFEELKELCTSFGAGSFLSGSTSRKLRETVRGLYKEALDNGEVDGDDF